MALKIYLGTSPRNEHERAAIKGFVRQFEDH